MSSTYDVMFTDQRGDTVYIGRYSTQVQRGDIQDFLRQCGRITKIVLKTGYCFVTFASPEDAVRAIHTMNDKQLCGCKVRVGPAQNQ